MALLRPTDDGALSLNGTDRDYRFQFVLPEMAFHAFLTTLFLLSGQWTALVLNAPLVAFNVNKYVISIIQSRPFNGLPGRSRRDIRGGATNNVASGVTRELTDTRWTLSLIRRILNKNHMYDATEIFRTLSVHKKECFIKLGFYLVSFFYYLYRCVLLALYYAGLNEITDGAWFTPVLFSYSE